MESIKAIAFRYLTNAEFFNINKPSGTEKKGGGQTYIDFPTKSVPRSDWEKFFHGVKNCSLDSAANGPRWAFTVKSIGLDEPKEISVYQRRKQSIIIAAQKLHSRGSKRVPSWHPDNGFPEPVDPMDRHALPAGLAVYLIRAKSGDIWAGWFIDSSICRDPAAEKCLAHMIDINDEGHAGMLFIENGDLYLDTQDKDKPFSTDKDSTPTASIFTKSIKAGRKSSVPAKRNEIKEEDLIESLFESDTAIGADEPETVEKVIKVKNRNKKAVSDLKKLYKGRCQVSGYDLTFKKKNGEYYSEAHHLIALGDEGSDSPFNIVIVSPLVHRMLHYADVGVIELSKLKSNDTLDVTINGEKYTISWHPEHAASVRKYSDSEL